MKAMALTRLGKIEESSLPLEQVSREVPQPGEEYHFFDANRALVELKTKKSTGAKVLVIN